MYLALLYDSQGKYDQAEPLYVECLELSKAVLGASHPDTLTTMHTDTDDVSIAITTC